MILHVANLGNPILRRIAQAVDPAEIARPRFQVFLDDLMESMRFHDGVGLAAPQVFRSQRVIAAWVPEDMDPAGQGLEAAVYINPELTPLDESLVEGWEGCLSLKDLRGLVPRHRQVGLRALDKNGEAIERELSDFVARVFQHEVDHLDGIVFVDRMRGVGSLVFQTELERFGPPDGSDGS